MIEPPLPSTSSQAAPVTAEELASAPLNAPEPPSPLLGARIAGAVMVLEQLIALPTWFLHDGTPVEWFLSFVCFYLGMTLLVNAPRGRTLAILLSSLACLGSPMAFLLWQDSVTAAQLAASGIGSLILLLGAAGRLRLRLGSSLCIVALMAASYGTYAAFSVGTTSERVEAGFVRGVQADYTLPVPSGWLKVDDASTAEQRPGTDVWVFHQRLGVNLYVSCEVIADDDNDVFDAKATLESKSLVGDGTLTKDPTSTRRRVRTRLDGHVRVDVVRVEFTQPFEGQRTLSIVEVHHLPKVACTLEAWGADIGGLVGRTAEPLFEGFELRGPPKTLILP